MVLLSQAIWSFVRLAWGFCKLWQTCNCRNVLKLFALLRDIKSIHHLINQENEQNILYCFSVSPSFHISQEEKKTGNSRHRKNKAGIREWWKPPQWAKHLYRQWWWPIRWQNLSQNHQHFSHETTRISFSGVKAHALSIPESVPNNWLCLSSSSIRIILAIGSYIEVFDTFGVKF